MVELVLLLIMGFVILPVTLAIVFGVLYSTQKSKRRQLERVVSELYRMGRLTEAEVRAMGIPLPSCMNIPPIQPIPPHYGTQQVVQNTQMAQTVNVVQNAQISQPQITPPPIQQVQLSQDIVQPKRSAMSTPANIILILGVLFVVLSGVIFATTTWDMQAPVVKAALLLLTSIVFFVSSWLAHKRFELKQTGAAFYALGSIFLPVSVLAIGFFELLGSWFSLGGRGVWLLGAASSWVLGGAMLIGYRIYKKSTLNWIFLMAVAAGIVSFGLFFDNTWDTALLGLTLYSVALLVCVEIKAKGIGLQSEILMWMCTFLVFIRGLDALPWGDAALPQLYMSSLMIFGMLFYRGMRYTCKPIYRHISIIFLILPIALGAIQLSDSWLPMPLIFSIAVSIVAVIYMIPVRVCETILRLRTATSDAVVAASLAIALILSMLAGDPVWQSATISGAIVILATIFAKERLFFRYTLPIPMCCLIILTIGELFTVDIGGLSAVIVLGLIGLTAQKGYFSKMRLPFLIQATIFGILFANNAFNFSNVQSVIPNFLSALSVLIIWITWYIQDRKPYIFIISAVQFPILLMYGLQIFFTDMPREFILILGGLALCVYAVVYRFCTELITSDGLHTNATNKGLFYVASIGLSIITVALVILQKSYTYGLGYYVIIIATLLLIAVVYALWHHRKMTLFGTLPIIAGMTLIAELFQQLGSRIGLNYSDLFRTSYVVAFGILLLIGRLVHRRLIERDGHHIHADCFTLSAGLVPVALILFTDRVWCCVGFLLTVLYMFNLLRRTGRESVDRLVMLLGVSAACMAIYVQPIIVIPDFIGVKLYLALPFIVLLICYSLIYTNRRATISVLTFVMSAVSSMILLVEALIQRRLSDALILGVLSLGLLVFSVFKHSKRWFWLSTVVLLIVAIYLTRNFWLQLSWWVYLLAVGVVLISLAVINEMYRKKGDSVKGKLSNVFNNWEW